MPTSYTKREIAYNLSCSERTIEEDQKYLNIIPKTSPGRPNLYSEQDYQLFRQMREHMQIENNIRDTFVENKFTEIVDERADMLVTKYESDIEYSIGEQIELIAKNDPFFDLKIMACLEKLADKDWLVSTKFIAALLQISTKTLLKYRQYSYGSFIICLSHRPPRKLRKEIVIKESKAILWRVAKIS